MTAILCDFLAARRARRRAQLEARLTEGARVLLPHQRGIWIVQSPPDRGRVYLRLANTAVLTFAQLHECEVVGDAPQGGQGKGAHPV